jgi:L-ribulose-5-phosphate 4-epimerase
LIIEIDGVSHNDKVEYDKKRNNKLESLDFAVLHFRDIDVKQNLQGVLDFIKDWIYENAKDPTTPDFSVKTYPNLEEVTHSDSENIRSHPSQEGIKLQAEQYSGVKFKTVFNSKTTPSHPNISNLKQWCKIFHKRNLAPPYPGGSYGNISLRVQSAKPEFIITGTQIGMKENLTNEKFVEVLNCDLKKKIVTVTGNRKPSSETMLHYAIYKNFPKVNTILHGHSSELLSNAETLGIPTTTEKQEYGTIKLVDSVLQILKNNKIIIMKDHGFVAVGNNIDEAGNLVLKFLDELESK